MHRHYDGDGYGHPFAMLVLAAVVIGLAALAAYLVVRASRRSQAPAPSTPHPVGPPASDAALDHARMRYARGELTRDAYVQVVSDLGGPPPPAAPPPSAPPAPDAPS